MLSSPARPSRGAHSSVKDRKRHATAPCYHRLGFKPQAEQCPPLQGDPPPASAEGKLRRARPVRADIHQPGVSTPGEGSMLPSSYSQPSPQRFVLMSTNPPKTGNPMFESLKSPR